MRLSLEKLRTEKEYRIGYIPLIDEYVMAVMKKEGERAYDSYFRISPKEYELYRGEVNRLDKIAEQMRTEEKASENFLFSENSLLNSTIQTDIYFDCRDSQKDRVNGGFERI